VPVKTRFAQTDSVNEVVLVSPYGLNEHDRTSLLTINAPLFVVAVRAKALLKTTFDADESELHGGLLCLVEYINQITKDAIL
jgi:hypothetical protein